MSQHDATVFATKNICRATYDDCRATESLYSATKNFSHTIKQLLHQYHKTLALCNIKGELASSFSSNIARSQYFVVLMQELINMHNAKYCTLLRPIRMVRFVVTTCRTYMSWHDAISAICYKLLLQIASCELAFRETQPTFTLTFIHRNRHHSTQWFCRVLLQYCTQPIFFVIDAITDKYIIIVKRIFLESNWFLRHELSHTT